MEFGIFYQLPCNPGQDPAERYSDMIAAAQLADRLGFDSVWLAELHFNPRFSVMPSPLLAAAAIAQTTTRIKIGTAVNLVPLHSPIRLAEEMATLDVLSKGRAIFGIGRGSNPSHFEGYGIDPGEGRGKFEEAVDFILQAWGDGPLTFKGEHYQAHGLSVVPKTHQKPHPPVYVAANGADTFQLVGDMGHNILVAPIIATNDGVQTGLDVYRKTLTKHGLDPTEFKVNVAVPTFVAEDSSQAHALASATVEAYLQSLREGSRGRGSSRAMSLTYESVQEEFGAIGDPEECIARLRKIKERFNSQEIMCWFDMGGAQPFHEVKQSMELFSREVMPHLR